MHTSAFLPTVMEFFSCCLFEIQKDLFFQAITVLSGQPFTFSLTHSVYIYEAPAGQQGGGKKGAVAGGAIAVIDLASAAVELSGWRG